MPVSKVIADLGLNRVRREFLFAKHVSHKTAEQGLPAGVARRSSLTKLWLFRPLLWFSPKDVNTPMQSNVLDYVLLRRVEILEQDQFLDPNHGIFARRVRSDVLRGFTIK